MRKWPTIWDTAKKTGIHLPRIDWTLGSAYNTA
jgi:hypothetical protein